MKKKKSNLENDNKVTELNGSLKEENDVAHDKKKKKQKENKMVVGSIDGDEKTSDIKSVTDTKDKKKKKQKKNKLVTESIDVDEKASLSEDTTDTKDKKKKKKKEKSELNVSLAEENGPHSTETENAVDVTEHKKKKQKKKDKLVIDSIDGDEEKSDIKSGLPEPSEVTRDTKDEKKKKKEKKKKSEVDVSLKEENDVQMTEAEDDVDVTKHKKKKQKKNKLATDSIDGDEKKSDFESVLPVEKSKTKDKKEKKKKKTKKETEEMKSIEPLDIGADNNQMSKKRKRSDEVEEQPAEETTVNDSKRRKSEGLEVDSKQIFANGETNGNDLLKLSKNGPDKSGQKQQRNDSAEPKTVHAFQRVKIDEVEFVDDRLQDNSYWAKSGAEKGYGAKAQEILGQVKGRDFRHEKTKKKRGSYRGGLIDQDSHSIKFNYSDEE